MNRQLRQYLETCGLSGSATEREAWRFFHALGGTKRTKADAHRRGRKPGRQAADPVQTERQRVSAIRELAGNDVPQRLITRAIDQGWSEAQSASEFLRYIREHRSRPAAGRGGPGIHSRNHERDCTARALAVGLMHRAGTDAIGRAYNQQRTDRLTERDADMGDRYRTMPLPDICREALRIDGRRIPHDREEMIRAAISTMTLSNIFSTSIHARLLAAYEEAADTSDWVVEEDVTNFQEQERASMGKDGLFEKLPKGGTAKHATLGDSVEKYRIARYAKQAIVDEQDLFDDNLNGFQQLPVEIGLSAARLRPDLVYSVLLANASLGADNVALFHNGSHSNDNTLAFNKANLQTVVTRMMQQTQDGVRLNIRPTHLIVPGDLEWDARELLTSTEVVIAGNTDTVRGNRNVLSDLSLQLRVEGRIDANGVTDPDSGTAYTGAADLWYLVASGPRSLVVGYLAGTGRQPQMRRFVLDKGQWGIGWDFKLDIGVKALDYRPFQRSEP